jgi:hypothetical protein
VGQAVLCETCFNTDDASNLIAQKVLKAPDTEISEGGEATPDHILKIAAAISERHDATEH